MGPVTVIESTTYNTAREIKTGNLGAIVPGLVTGTLLMESLEELKPSHVFYNGGLVAENGKLPADIKDGGYVIEYRDSMHVKKLGVEDFRIQTLMKNGTAEVSLMECKDLLLSSTPVGCEEPPVENGYPRLNDDDLKFIAVINHHEGYDTVVLGIVRGFNTTTGALALTVSHDSHNLTIVHDTAENALLVANELIICGGSMCAVKDGAVLHTSRLPLVELISLEPAEELAVDNALIKDANRTLGLVDMENPLPKIVTLALPVILEVKMSDPGLTDVLEKETILPFV